MNLLRSDPYSETFGCTNEGRVGSATVPDHIVPLWKGGPDEVGNLQPLCQSHHNVKTAAEAEKRVRGV